LAQCYKTFYVIDLPMFAISWRLCPWQALPANSNVCAGLATGATTVSIIIRKMRHFIMEDRCHGEWRSAECRGVQSIPEQSTLQVLRSSRLQTTTLAYYCLS
jgi:hypothetical protein